MKITDVSVVVHERKLPAGMPLPHHFSYGLTEPIAIDSAGNAHAPTRPGLGYYIDWELINASKLADIR